MNRKFLKQILEITEPYPNADIEFIDSDANIVLCTQRLVIKDTNVASTWSTFDRDLGLSFSSNGDSLKDYGPLRYSGPYRLSDFTTDEQTYINDAPIGHMATIIYMDDDGKYYRMIDRMRLEIQPGREGCRLTVFAHLRSLSGHLPECDQKEYAYEEDYRVFDRYIREPLSFIPIDRRLKAR